MVNWFAVHPTSMNNTNSLTSGDNKGYASQLFEEVMNPGSMPGKVRSLNQPLRHNLFFSATSVITIKGRIDD